MLDVQQETHEAFLAAERVIVRIRAGVIRREGREHLSAREQRAVWVEQVQDLQLAGTFSREHVKRIVAECKQLGATRLLWLLKARTADTASVLWYKSIVGPSHPMARLYDGLADGIELAHAEGIEVHGYFSVFPEGDPAGADLAMGEAVLARHPEWAVVDMNGKPTTFVCAGALGYRAYLLALIDEVLSSHQLDGIHLDFIRYPRAACFCARCLTEIRERFGLGREEVMALLETRQFAPRSYDERSTALNEADSLIDYYCENVHLTVSAIHGELKARHPKAALSAAVFPNSRSSTSQVYCDWVGFSQYLDFVCPMAYWYSDAHFERTVARLQSVVGNRTQLLPGISALGYAHALAGKNRDYLATIPDFTYLKNLIVHTRGIGTGGFALFHHAPIFGYDSGQYTGDSWGTPLAAEGREEFLRFLAQ